MRKRLLFMVGAALLTAFMLGSCGTGGGSHMEIQEKPDDHTWIEVISLDEKGVTYLLRRDITDEGQEITANYGSETKSHDTIVHDGQCCYRTMVFSDYTE